MTAYYNEIDPRGAASLRELIRRGIIAPGDIDDRSIEDVRPADLAGYVQCHFFAGIGVWSYALRCAGWPDNRPVWTGSCPCQPFSAAGKGAGVADERHLWPAWDWLIGQRRPRVVFGEQVESAILHGWLDLVQSDLEGKGYAFGPIGLPAAGFGAPHGRARVYFVADSGYPSGCTEQQHESGEELGRGEVATHGSGLGECRAACDVADAPDGDRGGGERRAEAGAGPDGEWRRGPASGGPAVIVGNPSGRGWGKFGDAALPGRGGYPDGAEQPRVVGHAVQPGLEGHAGDERDGSESRREREDPTRSIAAAGAVNGFWGGAEWIPCRDGKARPVEPGTFPLAHGAAARVGRLHLYGNAIVAPVAEAFVRAYMEVRA